jgi:replicative DNA helicase
MKKTSLAAEKMLLAAIINDTNKFFDLDNHIVGASDFSNPITECIYAAIKEILEEKGSSGKVPIDAVILEHRLSKMFPKIYENSSQEFTDAVSGILEATVTGDIYEHAKIVVTASVKIKSLRMLENAKKQVEASSDSKEIIKIIETSPYDFTAQIFKGNDIKILGTDFENWVAERQEEIARGKLNLGVQTGFPLYDEAIGGGILPKTNNVIVARPKKGKTFLGVNIANNVASDGIPVLYLDTELAEDHQNQRLCSMRTGLSLHNVKSLNFTTQNQADAFQKSIQEMKTLPIYYVDIAGWDIGDILSVIRRFYAKIVGKDPETGKYKQALVIYDYLKLMNVSDQGKNLQEYQALGYRMSMLHDLAKKYEISMITFGQQNREGIDKEDESTSAGSDRIVWYCDSLTIFKRKSDMELMAAKEESKANPDYKFSQCKLIVTNPRHGPGTPPRHYIGVYADFHNPCKKNNDKTGKMYEVAMEMPFSVDGK